MHYKNSARTAYRAHWFRMHWFRMHWSQRSLGEPGNMKQNATGQNAPGQNAPLQNATGQNAPLLIAQARMHSAECTGAKCTTATCNVGRMHRCRMHWGRIHGLGMHWGSVHWLSMHWGRMHWMHWGDLPRAGATCTGAQDALGRMQLENVRLSRDAPKPGRLERPVRDVSLFPTAEALEEVLDHLGLTQPTEDPFGDPHRILANGGVGSQAGGGN